MISGLRGTVYKKEATRVELDVNGVIYEVFISINTSSSIRDEKITLLITEIIKEDSHSLYGFLDKSEKNIFDRLIKISGIGAKIAIAICSTMTADKFLEAIYTKNQPLIQSVPGIGAKMASRLIVELGEFTIIDDTSNSASSNINDAILALESLGFKKNDINKVLSKITESETEKILKEALKILSK